ncbi:hypothetical protein C8J56DRAFT_893428 [Mycena floridula]|nr:hypothetical protein C8J56DRAFT_893428 [Mycena floridula]
MALGGGAKSKTGASALTASGTEGHLVWCFPKAIDRTLAFALPAASIELNKCALSGLSSCRCKLYNVAQHQWPVLPRSDVLVPDVFVLESDEEPTQTEALKSDPDDSEESEGSKDIEETTGVDG